MLDETEESLVEERAEKERSGTLYGIVIVFLVLSVLFLATRAGFRPLDDDRTRDIQIHFLIEVGNQ